MRGLALVLLQVFSLLAPALGLLGPSPFSRNALAFGVVPDVNVLKGALSADSPAVRMNSDSYLQPNKTLLFRGTGLTGRGACGCVLPLPVPTTSATII